jgi:hypothetical protein
LKFVVAYPIISTGPGVVASLWGALLFNEIRGKRNILVLLFAFALTFIGVGIITASKLV